MMSPGDNEYKDVNLSKSFGKGILAKKLKKSYGKSSNYNSKKKKDGIVPLGYDEHKEDQDSNFDF